MASAHPPQGTPEPLYSLVYASQATALMDDAQVSRIVGSCWRHNPPARITGLLMYDGGHFVQWLEGPQPAVRALMARLARDPRHTRIVELHASTGVAARLYPRWSMELVPPFEILAVLARSRAAASDPGQRQCIQALIDHLA